MPAAQTRVSKIHLLIAAITRHRTLFATLAAIVMVAIITGVIGVKAYAPVTVIAPSARVSANGPVTFKLTQTLGSLEVTKSTITPAIDGTWAYRHGSALAGDIVTFTPKHYFKENTTYQVALPKAKRLLSGTANIPTASFTTEKAPTLTKQGVAGWQQGQTVAADTTFSATLASPNHGLRAIELRTTPAIAVTQTVKDDTAFTWKPTDLLPQGTDITLEVFDTKNNETLAKITVHVAAEPSVTSPLQRGDVDERDSVAITFAEPMDSASAHITFDIPGNGTWQNDTLYVFSPQKVSPATTYNYTIQKGARSKAGGILLADISGEFSTIGAVSVTGMSPYGNGLAQGQQTLSFTFSRPVDHASATDRLAISSGTVTGTYWKGNTLYATVANLGFQQQFSATMGAGVKNTSFGAPSNRPYSLGFTTEVRSVKLAIPFFRQQYSGSCTAASLRMALAYRGIGSDDMSLVQQMGYNPRPKDNSTSPPTWDDPQTMFVGDINGSIQGGTGAGPDAPPVAKAARAMGRGASAVTGIGAGWIAEQIYNGNPVIMFGAFRATGTTTWQTPSGRTATMNLTGHASTVIGVSGEPGNPLGFWVNDPLSGGTAYWSVGAVNANISRDPYRQAVVVY